jgi:type I restriction enzyme, S subunit
VKTPLICLKDITILSDNGTWGDESNADTGMPVLRSTNIQENKMVLNEVAWRDLSQKHRETKMLQTGDILVTTSSGSPHLIGKCCTFQQPENGRSYYFSNFTMRLRIDATKMEPKWLYYWLISERGRNVLASMNSTTSGLRNLNKNLYLKQKIPCPELQEQRRIVAILDKVFSVSESIATSSSMKPQLIRSVFIDMFGDMLTNPMNWPVMKLGEVCESQLGKAISNEAKLCKAPSKYLRNENVKWRKIEFHDLKEMDFKDSEKHKLTLHDGDVLATEGGNVGRCAIWKYGNQNIYFQNSLHRIRVNLDVLTPEYLVEYFSIMSERGGLIRETTQVTIAHLTGHKLKQLPLPLPPLVLQQKFIRILKQIRVLSEENLTRSQNLNLSLKQEMLT